MSIKNRVRKIEQQAQTKSTWRDFIEGKITPDEWERGMNALAEALGITRAELDNQLETISDEHKK